ncbi:ArnT family glycosyltransferase [Tundrisphaera sp. TA3]|uniref:ArnT family glycosyltransferase n=1 Tax=Tundrisphaera sp. TA3 TaxID=3435775 RepID=UPI003EBF8F30
MSDTSAPNRQGPWPLALIVSGGVLIRLALIVAGGGRLDDPDNYLPLARSLAGGDGLSFGGRPTAYRPPLYPILLAPLAAAFEGKHLLAGVAAFQLILAAMTIVLAGATARRWGLSFGRSLAAAAVVAFDPVLALQARSVMTETLAAFLVALTLFLLTLRGPRGAIAGGIGFGLAALCRPSLLPGAGLTAGAALICGPGAWPTRAARSGLIALATILTLTPWAIRNARIFGEPVWTTTHGGYTLALANNPVYYREILDGPPGAVWSGESLARWQEELTRPVAGLPEPEADRRIAADVRRLIRERPGTFARASLARLGRFWGIAPSGSVYSTAVRLATAAWTVPLWAALAVGLLRPGVRRWPAAAAACVIVALSIVHILYWTDLRMRSPIVPAIALIAAGWARPGRRDEAE